MRQANVAAPAGLSPALNSPRPCLCSETISCGCSGSRPIAVFASTGMAVFEATVQHRQIRPSRTLVRTVVLFPRRLFAPGLDGCRCGVDRCVGLAVNGRETWFKPSKPPINLDDLRCCRIFAAASRLLRRGTMRVPRPACPPQRCKAGEKYCPASP